MSKKNGEAPWEKERPEPFLIGDLAACGAPWPEALNLL